MKNSFFNQVNEQQAQAQQLIALLKSASESEQVDAYNSEFSMLQKKLIATHSKEEFMDLGQQIIALQKEIHNYLSSKMTGNKGVLQYLTPLLAQPQNINIRNLFIYTEIATHVIGQAKENLDLEQMYKALPIEKRNEAETFINSLRALKPLADAVIQNNQQLAQILDKTLTMDELEKIEQDIDSLSVALRSQLIKFISYPRDLQVIEATRGFLQNHPHFRTMLDAFNPQEMLMDKVLDAKVRAEFSKEGIEEYSSHYCFQ